jgi:glycine/D-amino acid oxidase-like deaminating enzyme
VTLDLAIVGNGIAGLSLAFELSRRTALRIALVAPKKASAKSASAVAQGISAIKGLLVAREPLFKAKLSAHQHLSGWLSEVERSAGVLIPQDHSGVGELCSDLAGYQLVAGRVYQRRFQGAFSPRLGFYSGSTDSSVYGYFYPRDFWFDPPRTMLALQTAIASCAQFIPATVKFINALPSGVAELCLDDGVLLKTKQVVLAAGSETVALLDGFDGVFTPGWRETPGETLFVSPGNNAFNRPVFRPGSLPVSSFVRGTKSITLTPNGDLIAGSWKENDRLPDERLLADFPAELGLLGLKASGLSISRQWGVRLRTRDRAPVCGPISARSDEVVWLFTGFYKNGLQLAPFLAPLLAEALVSRNSNLIPPEFSSARFL